MGARKFLQRAANFKFRLPRRKSSTPAGCELDLGDNFQLKSSLKFISRRIKVPSSTKLSRYLFNAAMEEEVSFSEACAIIGDGASVASPLSARACADSTLHDTTIISEPEASLSASQVTEDEDASGVSPRIGHPGVSVSTKTAAAWPLERKKTLVPRDSFLERRRRELAVRREALKRRDEELKRKYAELQSRRKMLESDSDIRIFNTRVNAYRLMGSAEKPRLPHVTRTSPRSERERIRTLRRRTAVMVRENPLRRSEVRLRRRIQDEDELFKTTQV